VADRNVSDPHTRVAAAAALEVGCHGNGRGHNKLASYGGLLGVRG